MKGSVVAFDTVNGRGAAAWMQDGRLHDLLIDPPVDRIRPGSVFRAKAGRPMKGQGGMILETPAGALFLRQTKGVAPGQMLLVQTTTYAEPGKATPCTPRLTLKSRYVIVTPGARGVNVSRQIREEERVADLKDLAAGVRPDFGDLGVIIRSSAGQADDDVVTEDLNQMLDLAGNLTGEAAGSTSECLLEGPDAAGLAWQDWAVPDMTDSEAGSFDRHGVSDAIDMLRGPRTSLPGGGSFYVEPTRALVAIDVNTGGDTSAAAGLKTNVEALRAIPRALRLRGLGGQIVIDLAPFAKRDRTQLEQVASTALKADGIETNLVGWTPLGHLELQRKRERLPLSEVL